MLVDARNFARSITPRIAMIVLLSLGAWVAGCSSGNESSGDDCAQASQTCGASLGSSCTPRLECEAQCLLENGCSVESSARCALDRCATNAPNNANDGPPDVGTTTVDGAAQVDAGSGGDDASTGGWHPCDPYFDKYCTTDPSRPNPYCEAAIDLTAIPPACAHTVVATVCCCP